MEKELDVYTTIGRECGCCGHRHRNVREAGSCLAEYRRQGPSDRRVVAVAADALWPPTEGRDLNHAEIDALYGDADALAASYEHERLAIFAAGVAADVAALRRVADALHNAWAEGGFRGRHAGECRNRSGWVPRHGTGARDRRADRGLCLCSSTAVLLTSLPSGACAAATATSASSTPASRRCGGRSHERARQ